MADLREPGLEPRRGDEFERELVARLRAWLPGWNLEENGADPGRALLTVWGRILGQVAERADRMSAKTRHNLYAWLGIRGNAAQATRLPVVLRPSSSATEAVLAAHPVQLQAGATPLETERDLRVVPAQVVCVAAVDAATDSYYLPGLGFSQLDDPALVPTQWRVVSFAANGARSLQLDPPLGLDPGVILEVGGKQFRIVSSKADIVGIEPAIDLPEGVQRDWPVRKVTEFEPFDGAARNRQQHALYIGHDDLLNIESTAQIEVRGAAALASGFTWQYWGKEKPVEGALSDGTTPNASAASEGDDASAWRRLTVLANDPTRPGVLVLEKSTPGSVEKMVVGGISGRWLRAVCGSLDGAVAPLSFADLRLQVGSARAPARPAIEGLANTTPLVLDSPFLPLGSEPRQFDAFYLGCAEVFSKLGASVTLDFRIADSSFTTLSAADSGVANRSIVAGVAGDGSLHLLAFDRLSGLLSSLEEALQPAASGASGRVSLQPKPLWRVPMWRAPGPLPALRVAVATEQGRTVWVYTQNQGLPPFIPAFGTWAPSGPPVAAPSASTDRIDGLVHVDGAGEGTLYALFNARLYARPAASSSAWTDINLTSAGKVQMIAPVRAAAATAQAAVLVAVDLIEATQEQRLLAVNTSANSTVLATGGIKVASTVQPVASRVGGDVVIIAAAAAPVTAVIAVRLQGGTINGTVSSARLDLAAGESCLGFDFDDGAAVPRIVVTAVRGNDSRLLWWEPDFAPGATQSIQLDAPVPLALGSLVGAPLRLSQFALVPGDQASIFELPVQAASGSGAAPIQFWVRPPPLSIPLGLNDLVVIERESLNGVAPVSGPETVVAGARYLPLGNGGPLIPPAAPGAQLAFRSSAAVTATVDSATTTDCQISFNPPDALDGGHSLVLVESASGGFGLYQIGPITKTSGQPSTATLAPAISPMSSIKCSPPVDLTGAVVETMLLFDQGSGGPGAGSGDRLLLEFPGASPQRRIARVLLRQADGRPKAAALQSNWITWPPTPPFGLYGYTIVAGPGPWTRPIAATESNPELVWEYANGRSWWQLPRPLDDTTNNLKTSGQLRFDIPSDIATSDWSGRSNFWIRARLVGGDYGREVFTVTATTVGSTTTQQVQRSTEGMRPPLVVSLAVTYSMSQATYPEHVLAEDAGTVRDQSDANRTAGAEVEAFVPLAVQLSRLASTPSVSSVALAADADPSACGCASTAAPPSINEIPAPKADSVAGRSMMLGLSGRADGALLGLLLAVAREGAFDALAPLRVAALVEGRFETVAAQDETRALGESGVLEMAIAHAPTSAELFGQALSWLQVAPALDEEWTPSLAGAWLNATWARSAQTQTFEVLGSSQGEPGATYVLARPPLLRDTLELRVNESLSDEEVEALRAADHATVVDGPPDAPGTWVRWTQVGDPADEAPMARVYACDEATGEVRFGDGHNGMIPPIGRDNIVAFSYRRTEPPAAGAPAVPTVAARSTLSLVTPVEGVESAVAALDSGAGAAPDNAERVLRFAPARLRHRGRVLTAADLEDLALQSLPTLAQARCVQDDARARLVAVMRGADPRPSRAIKRQLQALLLLAMPPQFSAAATGRSLVVEAPVLRALRVRLTLRVATLDVAGAVGKSVEAALSKCFDSASGGDDGRGWPLGRSADAAEVAAVLVDTTDLEGIDDIALLDAETLQPWPARLAADELLVLGDGAVEIRFTQTLVVA